MFFRHFLGPIVGGALVYGVGFRWMTGVRLVYLQDQIRKFDDLGYGILPSQSSEEIDKDICYPQKQMQVVDYNIGQWYCRELWRVTHIELLFSSYLYILQPCSQKGEPGLHTVCTCSVPPGFREFRKLCEIWSDTIINLSDVCRLLSCLLAGNVHVQYSFSAGNKLHLGV